MGETTQIPTSTHWGNHLAEVRDGRIEAVHPTRTDTDPSPVARSLLSSQDPGCRIPRPSVRRGYLDAQWRSDGSKRGAEPFVAVPWDEALDLAGQALAHVVAEHGNEAIFGGSAKRSCWGWISTSARGSTAPWTTTRSSRNRS